jgi:hypothetical protein
MAETRAAPSAPAGVPTEPGAGRGDETPAGAGGQGGQAAPASRTAGRPARLAGRVWRWLRYEQEGRRDLRLDLLRGFCAFAMVVDHLGGASYLYPVTGGNQFFVSAAEGFIFLSGLLVGLIYGPRARRDGLAAVQSHLLRRAFVLYAVTIGLTFAFVGLSRLTQMPWLPEVEPFTAELAVSILTLHRTYYLVDVMLLYTLLLVVSPLALLLLTTGRTWVVLMLSGGLWLLFQWFPVAAQVPWTIVNNDTFRVSAWQVWFFGGMVIGYHRSRIWRWLGRLPLLPALAALAGAAGLLIAFRLSDGASLPLPGAAPQGQAGQAVLDALFGKEFARPGRLLAFAVFFPLLYLILTYAWVPFSRLLGWLLVPFGQNALYVYAMHLFAVYLTALVLPYVPGFDRFNPDHNTPVQLAAVLVIWVLVKREVLFDVIPR